MSITSFRVSGMTCGHCAMAVTREVSALPGVSDVQVSLPSGAITVTHDQPLAHEQVAAAIDEAGYRLTA